LCRRNAWCGRRCC